MIIGMLSLTNFVFAQGETTPTETPKCQACSSGSPLMSSYMTMISEIIAAVWLSTNIDPWAIGAQWYNVETKNKWTRERVSNTANSRLDITNQARGVKSDMTALNKAQERIISAGNTVINTKFQYNQQVETKVVSAITTALNKQVWTNKLFIKQWAITSSDYDDLLLSLIQLHQYVAKIPTAESWYSFVWQWYQSNPTTISGLISYYRCAQTVLTCNSNTSLLKQTGMSIRWYRSDIVRAWSSIKETTSKSYRDTGKRQWPWLFQKWWLKSIINNTFSVTVNWEWASDVYKEMMWDIKQFGWEWKQSSKDKKAKRATKEEQQQKQEQAVEDLEWAQAAASIWWEVVIEETTAQPTVTTNSPWYKQWEISILVAALNSATDVNLSQRVEAQRYTTTNDSTIITYKIPKLTRQIYDTTQVIKTSANAIVNTCKQHCANVPWYCGEEIK